MCFPNENRSRMAPPSSHPFLQAHLPLLLVTKGGSLPRFCR